MVERMKVLYSPIDLPDFQLDIEKFLKWHTNKKRRALDNIGYDKNEFRSPWLLSFAYKEELGWCDEFLSIAPDFKDIIAQAPFTKLTYINFLEQKIPCQEHQDWTSRGPETGMPDTYKAFIFYDQPLMYMKKGRTKEQLQSEKHYIHHPLDKTRWFGLNNYDGFHAGEIPSQGIRKIIMTIKGEIDLNKHKTIIDRSIEKYKDYLITLDM